MDTTPLLTRIKELEDSILALKVKRKTLSETGKKRRNKKKKIDLNLKRKNARLQVLRDNLAKGVVSEQTLDTGLFQDSSLGKLNVLQQVNPAHSDPVYGVCFLPDKQIASACEDNTVQIWTIETQDCLAILDHESPVRCVTSLPGSRIATGTDEGVLTVWDLSSPSSPLFQESLDASITALVSVPGPALLVGLESGHLFEYLVSKKGLKKLKDFAEVADKAISKIVPFGDMALSSSLEGSVRIWNFSEKTCMNKLKFPRPVTTFDIIMGDRLVIAQENLFFSCKLNDVKKFEAFMGEGDSIITSTTVCGEFLATSYASGVLKLWNCENDSEVVSLQAGSEITSLFLDVDGSEIRCSTGSKKGTINIWRFPDLKKSA